MGGSAGINRHLHDLYLSRPDLRRAFPDLDGADARALVEWAHQYGQHEVPIGTDLLPDIDDDLRRAYAAPNGHAPPAPDVPPDWWGVNVVGFLRSELGLGEGARQIVGALDARGVPLLPIQGLVPPDCRQAHPFTTLPPVAAGYPVNLVYQNPDGLWELYREVGPSFFAGRHSIGFWWWEAEDAVPAQWLSVDRGLLDEVWVGTRHVARCLEPFFEMPIRQVRVPIAMPEPPRRARAELDLPEGFLFLFAFDYNSAFQRKNPLAVVEAFSAAFHPDDGAHVAIKCINSEVDPANHARLLAASERPDVHVLDGYVSADDKNALMAACDCYVSLHRAEGLGHTIAEAMSLGKPVIATGYSGNLDFMSGRNGYLVDHAMTGVGPGVRIYPREARWAEPDVGHAARLMRHVFGDRAAAAERGRIAAADVRATHSPAAAGRVMERALEDIRRDMVRPNPARGRLAGARAGLAETAALLEAGEGEAGGRAGPIRRLVRRTLLRLLRPHTARQRRLDAQLAATLAESVTALDRLAARVGTAEVAATRARGEVLAALRRPDGVAAPVPLRSAERRRAFVLGSASSANGSAGNGRATTLSRQVETVPSWWHSIDLGDGVITPGHKGLDPGHMMRELEALRLPEDLSDWTVLDIGAWDGFYSFEAERRGASRVVALDHYAWEIDRMDGDRRHPDTLPGRSGFDLAHRVLGSRVEPLVADISRLEPEQLGAFDLVLFLGVLYHLEDPLGAMRRVAALTRELAIIETAAIALGAEHEERPLWELYPADEFAGDPTNWWAPNLRAVHDLCRAAGFRRSETIVGPRADGPAQYRAIVHAWM